MGEEGSAWKFGQVCDLPTFPHPRTPSPQALPSGPDALRLPHRHISIPASPGRWRWQRYRQASRPVAHERTSPAEALNQGFRPLNVPGARCSNHIFRVEQPYACLGMLSGRLGSRRCIRLNTGSWSQFYVIIVKLGTTSPETGSVHSPIAPPTPWLTIGTSKLPRNVFAGSQ